MRFALRGLLRKEYPLMWSFPIPFCLPLFRTGLALGLLVAAVGAYLPWVIPVASVAAIIVSPRLGEWTDVLRHHSQPRFAMMTVAEAVARRFRRPEMVRTNLAVSAMLRTIFVIGFVGLGLSALMPGTVLQSVRATSYWRLCYEIGLPLPDGMRMVGYPDQLRLLVGDVGLLWPPLCAFGAAAAAIALPLWLGAMDKGFEAVQGRLGWGHVGTALLGAFTQIPLGMFALFATMTGLGPYPPAPPVGIVVLLWLVQPGAWALALGRVANLGSMLAALLSGRRTRIGW